MPLDSYPSLLPVLQSHWNHSTKEITIKNSTDFYSWEQEFQNEVATVKSSLLSLCALYLKKKKLVPYGIERHTQKDPYLEGFIVQQHFDCQQVGRFEERKVLLSAFHNTCISKQFQFFGKTSFIWQMSVIFYYQFGMYKLCNNYHTPLAFFWYSLCAHIEVKSINPYVHLQDKYVLSEFCEPNKVHLAKQCPKSKKNCCDSSMDNGIGGLNLYVGLSPYLKMEV